MLIRDDYNRRYKRIIMNLKSNDPLTAMDKVKYCLNMWTYNSHRFSDSEREYYMGILGKNPHGIPDFYWQKAYKFYSMGIHRLGTGLFTWLSFDPIIKK